MKYERKLPDKMMLVEGVQHYHCSLCGNYFPYELMTKRDSLPFGVTRNCRECFNTVYNKHPKRKRRSSQELIEFYEAQKEFRHINFWGITPEQTLEVEKVMERLGYTKDEPVWVQFHRKHGFKLPSNKS